MNKDKDPKKQNTTIVADGGTVILHSVGPVHHGTGDQINLFVSTQPENPKTSK